MANTDGGLLVLGAEELKDGSLKLLGIKNVERVKKDLWNTLNNPQKVSVNLLADEDVEIVEDGGIKVLVVRVPRASRKQRPIYINGNPLTGTYRRNFEGDYRVPEAIVRRMIAEADEDTRDSRILAGFGLDDLDADTIDTYRNLFRSVKPTHPWLRLNDAELLSQLGGWARDRATGEEGLTLAGLLMFGKFRPIHEAVPFYQVDYQERPEDTSRQRWTDRVTTDGTWSGNVLDFYLKVISRLTADAKVPFRLEEKHRRVDESAVQEALREALVNTLVHADYSGSTGIVVVKKTDGYSFRNPGSLRLPVDEVEAGGRSDSRNRILQKMFQMIGEGEQAGSGFSKIMSAWREQHWRRPVLREDTQLDETRLDLPTISLLPGDVVEELEKRLGESLQRLDEVERVAVATAYMEGEVSHRRLRELSSAHPRDLTMRLQGLVRRGLLVPEGAGRLMTYHLASVEEAASHNSSTHVGTYSPHKGDSSPQMEAWLVTFRERRRVPAAELEAAVLKYTSGVFRTSKEIAEALGRSPRGLHEHTITPMVRGGKLQLRFPDRPNHPQQAYQARVP